MVVVRLSRKLIPAVLAMLAAPAAAADADFSQADAMLDLLRTCAEGAPPAQKIERVLALPQAQLLIAQQNISRLVTASQYRAVLLASCEGKTASLRPAGPGIRGELGVKGLSQDIAPALLWARHHVPLLRARVRMLKRARLRATAMRLAQANLPVPMALRPRYSVVMGGRAGAAAIGEDLYVDVLAATWKAAASSAPPLTGREAAEFFAHETHHLGLGRLLERKRGQLELALNERQAWDVVSGLVMEGGATLLVNGRGNLNLLRGRQDMKAALSDLPRLFNQLQRLLRRLSEGPLPRQQYEAESGFLAGMAPHALGAVMLAAVERHAGRAAMMAVLSDPRRLLVAYNAAVAGGPAGYRFDDEIAQRISTMGAMAAR